MSGFDLHLNGGECDVSFLDQSMNGLNQSS